MKTFFLIRHAKSSWKHPELSDRQRPLNKRGKRDAPRIGRYLADQQIVADLIISSPANRALTTAKTIAPFLQYELEQIRVEEDVYDFSGGEDIMILMKTLPTEVERLFIFGHNPTFTDLANYFIGKIVLDNVPTCGVVGFDCDIENWRDFSPKKCTLKWYMFPKMLAEKYDE